MPAGGFDRGIDSRLGARVSVWFRGERDRSQGGLQVIDWQHFDRRTGPLVKRLSTTGHATSTVTQTPCGVAHVFCGTLPEWRVRHPTDRPGSRTVCRFCFALLGCVAGPPSLRIVLASRSYRNTNRGFYRPLAVDFPLGATKVHVGGGPFCGH